MMNLCFSLSHVDLSTNGALLLIRSLADCQRVTAVELRYLTSVMSDIKLGFYVLKYSCKSQILIVAFNMILRHQAEAFIKFVLKSRGSNLQVSNISLPTIAGRALALALADVCACSSWRSAHTKYLALYDII